MRILFSFSNIIRSILGGRKRGKMGQRCPDDLSAINQITGMIFRFLREDSDRSLDEVAAFLEIPTEEVLAHESGANPLSTARLYHAGCLFGVKISAFFQPFYFPESFEDVEDDREPMDGRKS